MWVYVLSILAALCFGAGSVVQQRAASEAPPEDVLSWRLLLWLVHRPLWLAGVAFALVGNLFAANALGRGSIALVEPLFVVRLLFALPLAAAWMRRSVPRRDWAGALATSLGLAMFVVAGNPHQGTPDTASNTSWIIMGGALIGLALVLMVVARRLDPVRAAVLLAAGAGLTFGLQAALTGSAMHILKSDGLTGMLTSWHPYAVAAVALFGTLLIQSAYESAPLPASFPALVTVEPLVGIALGVGVLGGSIRFAPLPFAIEIAGIAVMVGGIYLLASSPLVTGQLDRLERRHEEGLAYRTEEELERDLLQLNLDLDRFEQHLGEPALLRKDRKQIGHDLARIKTEVERLCALQDDIRRHRAAEREHMESRTAAERRHFYEEHDPLLDLREQEIDQRAQRLHGRAERLRERARELTAEAVEASKSSP